MKNRRLKTVMPGLRRYDKKEEPERPLFILNDEKFEKSATFYEKMHIYNIGFIKNRRRKLLSQTGTRLTLPMPGSQGEIFKAKENNGKKRSKAESRRRPGTSR